MTTTNYSTRTPPPSLTKCPACHAAWSSADSICVPVEGLADKMLGGFLKYRVQELAYRRCSNCGSLIAIDERRDPQLLRSIYEDLPASYWHGLNEQIGFHSVIERHLRERGVLRE